MVNIAKETSYALSNAFSLEMWGGATFDVAMRFLYEDPWERLVRIQRMRTSLTLTKLIFLSVHCESWYLTFHSKLSSAVQMALDIPVTRKFDSKQLCK